MLAVFPPRWPNLSVIDNLTRARKLIKYSEMYVRQSFKFWTFGGYVGILGDEKIMKYSLIQKPQTDGSSAKSSLRICFVCLIKYFFQFMNYWPAFKNWEISRQKADFFQLLLEIQNFWQYWIYIYPWHWPAGSLDGVCTLQFTRLHLAQFIHFIHSYYLLGPCKHLSL